MQGKFKIKENGFDEIRNKVLQRTIPICVIATAGGLSISLFNSNGQTADVNTLPFIIPIILGALSFGFFKGLNRQKKIFNSFVLTIDESAITREQDLTPAISIPIIEIQQVVKSSKGAFIIEGKSPQEVIIIPSQIENSEALELILSELKSIKMSDEKTLVQKYQWAFPILTVILMVTTYLSTNKLLVGIAGTSLIIGIIYSLITSQRSKHIDKKTKRNMWFVLIVLFTVITIMYFKLTN